MQVPSSAMASTSKRIKSVWLTLEWLEMMDNISLRRLKML